MASDGRSTVGALLRFSGLLIVAGGALALLGWYPTNNLGGASGIRGMLAGIGVGLAASLVGALPALRAKPDGDTTQLMVSLLGGSGLRIAVALALSLAIVLGSEIERAPFLIWVGLSYLALLPLDVLLTLRQTRPPA